jgi:dolichyl-phosphate beta-glucosyltransferase
MGDGVKIDRPGVDPGRRGGGATQAPRLSWRVPPGDTDGRRRQTVEERIPRQSAVSTSLTLVVPLYNESLRVLSSANALAAFVAGYAPGSELLFVDDGSTDETPALIRRFMAQHAHLPVRLLGQPHLGKGAAVSAGLRWASTEVAAFCDVDLATPLGELGRVVDAAARAPVLAIGSRGTGSSRITRRQARPRELLGRAFNKVVQLAVVPGVVDTQCGAKAAPTVVWKEILGHSVEAGLAWDVEVIGLARTFGVPVQEVGIEWRHRDGSRVRVVRDGVRMLLALPRIRRRVATIRRARATSGAGRGPFDAEMAGVLASADATHWWFRCKATLVSLALRRSASTRGWLVDLGAGAGGVTAMLGWAPDRTLALDGNAQLVDLMTRRHALTGALGDTSRVPVASGSASVVCLLDVIEHLTDPVPTIREAARVLADDGRLVVNVPAHPRLWSPADEALGHARRYTLRSLRRDLRLGGCEVVWASHVFSWLALPVWIRRRLRAGDAPELGLDVESPLIDRLSMLLTRLEWFVASRVPLRMGTSILCVAKRTDVS